MRRWWQGIVLLGVLSAAGFLHGEQGLLKVDEDHIRLHLLPNPKIDFPITSSASLPSEGAYLLEMLDSRGVVVSSKQGAFLVVPGNSTVKVEWEEAQLPTLSPSQLGWFRLRYTITPKATGSFAAAHGVVQLGPLIAHAFELRITGAASVVRGTKYPMRVRVSDPGTGHPCSGVPVELTLTIDEDDDHALQRKVTTDAAGYAVSTFQLPSEPSTKKGEISAIARRNALVEKQSIQFEFLRQPSVTITTDKPLYQPGQTLHMRLLAFGDDKQAWPDANIDVRIEDSEGQESYRSKLTTSPFGVATADWEIPAKLRLDEYTISAEIDGPDHDNIGARARVRINRYELPEFAVKVKPDQRFYLPGQDAHIEVSADYLFGKPVQRAKVRIVRQQERHWNVQEQKWEAEESPPVEGELDPSGKFVGAFSLKESFEDFEESNYRRFQDATLAAYVTDLSSGRTEQRRFNLRLTYQPIHPYLTVQSSLATDQPILAYVTSSYADGTPASVTGTIEAARPNDTGEFDDKPDARHRIPIGRFHTNRYGVARVELPRLPENVLVAGVNYGCDRAVWDGCESAGRWTARLLLRGADRGGRKGEYSQDAELVRGLDSMRVRTERTLYHPSESIAGSIQSNTRAKDVIVGVASEGGLLSSLVVQLDHGKGTFSVPYDARFRGQIDILVHAMSGGAADDRPLWAAASVIYPSRQELKVTTRLAKTTFRPGENARVNVRVDSPEGKAAESALGVLVFDRAVAERVRSDEEFGHGYEFSIFDYYREYGNSIAGITYRDLLNLDAEQPYSPDLDLLAELLIRACFRTYIAASGGTADYAREAARYFAVKDDPRIKAVEKALEQIYKSSGDYPKTESDYWTMLKSGGIDPDGIRDPWDTPYRPVFSVSGPFDLLSLVSNGVDKRVNTTDDFSALTLRWMYFKKTGEAIDAALFRYQKNTGQYIRDYPTLREELAKGGVDSDSLRDPWGTPYAFSFPISGPYFQVSVKSAGPDRRFDSERHPSHDDVSEWTASIHYFQQETADLNRALSEHFARMAGFPQNEDELRPILRAAGLTPTRLLDPWGNSYHFSFNTQSRYWDRIDVREYTPYQGQTQKKTEITPVTQKLAYILVTSYGPENKPEAAFSVAEFSRVIAEMSSGDIRAMSTPKNPPRSKGTGGIVGTVTDPTGAVITGALVVATSDETGLQFTTKTNSWGTFALSDLPVGIYRLQFTSPGFRVATVVQVPVEEAGSTRVDESLRIVGATETVEVQAAAVAVETSASQASVKMEQPFGTQKSPGENQIFTPRLRKYFPETLLWRPEIVTDDRGNASFAFLMGDTITAWKMSIVASTRKGKLGVAERELRTFQPFFLVHDPPPVLTEGDRISLPVTLRNYSEKTQRVETELQPEAWFSILSVPRQSVTVEPNSDANAIFSLRASASTKKGMQRVTARNAETGDAVERQVVVHPDGQQLGFTTAKVLDAREDWLDFVVPDSAIRGSAEAELRIYPNLIAHMIDAMHGLAVRPAGCTEQITSIAYANLLVLQALKKTGQDSPAPGNPHGALRIEARKNVQDAYLMLGQAQHADGSFSYWNGRNADLALTAYVLRFLSRASEFVDVDQGLIIRARRYLLAQQAKTGAWRRSDWKGEKEVDAPSLTAYVARALATTTQGLKDKETKEMDDSLAAAMNYLEAQISSWSDAYLVGNYAIAALASGRKERIASAESSLKSLVHREGPTSYWNLEANTSPFYGWGLAGRVETTALAVEAFTALHAQDPEVDMTEVSRGVQFLLAHKDRYAMWYSTQATQNVMEALLAALPSSLESGNGSDASLTLNGSNVATIKLPSSQTVAGPIVVELDEHLARGANHLQLLSQSNTPAMNVALLASYYVPNSESGWTNEESLTSGDKRALRLRVKFDRTDVELKDAVTCEVEGERIGFRGYGMLVAEVGLPPGADVDRASLEAAKESGSVDAYEVQPDKVVFYLWPAAGGARFVFRFHSRLRMEAISGPSLLYDYYNPEAAARVRPMRFTVH